MPLCPCAMSSSRILLLLVLVTPSFAKDTALRGKSEKDVAHNLTEVPDVNGLPDTPGPYTEVPSDADAEKPKPAMPDWRLHVPNATQGSLGSLLSLEAWQDYQFCAVHKTGFFCEGTTRIRCCKLEDSYAKCGSVVHSSTCGFSTSTVSNQPEPDSKQKALWYPMYPMYPTWRIHPGWHPSSFCQSYHVGSFCQSHHIIHCCNDHGHFVECNSAFSNSGGWC